MRPEKKAELLAKYTNERGEKRCWMCEEYLPLEMFYQPTKVSTRCKKCDLKKMMCRRLSRKRKRGPEPSPIPWFYGIEGTRAKVNKLAKLLGVSITREVLSNPRRVKYQ